MVFYQIPETLDGEIKEFEGKIEDYQQGELNPIAFKGVRVSHGIYEQRKPETHMVRIRCSGGGISPAQLKRVGELAKQYGSGEIHVTTRQEMQLHYVKLDDVVTVYKELVKVGLSTRGGGGNTIRNILSPHDSGVAEDEVFDVMPYAMALTTRMIAESDSWNLPRKFKIAFSNREQDEIRATITCLGFIAKVHKGEKGFKVYCAGGMGAKPMPGKVLFPFIPANRVYHLTKAAKLMFDKYGNRRRRNIARLKFLWDKLGEENFREKIHEEYDKLVLQEGLELALPTLVNQAEIAEGYQPEPVEGPRFEHWKSRFVRPQKQAGLFTIDVPLALGDIDGDDAVKIAATMKHFGDNSMRFTVFQNLFFRNIPEAYLGNIFNLLTSIHTLSNRPALFGKMIACTGADTCKLGICLPRGLTPNIQKLLLDSDLELDQLKDVKIHISGCPNTCGCHHAADLGFFGKVMRVGKDMLPAYNILVGAILEEGKTRFSRKAGEIPSKDLPQFVKAFLSSYLDHKDAYGSFTEYVDDRGEEDIQRICATLPTTPAFSESEDYYFDWGSKERFSLLKGQKAECSAGMFDMIDVDGKAAKEALMHFRAAEDEATKADALSSALLYACRMLLVTRGIETKTDEQVFNSFLQHFIRTDLVPDRFTELVGLGIGGDKNALLSRYEEVADLLATVQLLYKNMDDSLRFRTTPAPAETSEKPNLNQLSWLAQ